MTDDSEWTKTASPSPTDDELVRIAERAFWNPQRLGHDHMRDAIDSIRPHLEARGIDMAADRALGYGEEPGVVDELRAFAWRHAEGGKNE